MDIHVYEEETQHIEDLAVSAVEAPKDWRSVDGGATITLVPPFLVGS